MNNKERWEALGWSVAGCAVYDGIKKIISGISIPALIFTIPHISHINVKTEQIGSVVGADSVIIENSKTLVSVPYSNLFLAPLASGDTMGLANR